MSGVAIYMEGGGNGRDTKAALRQGMDALLAELKDAARARSWHWRLVCCGGRDEAVRAFDHAWRDGDIAVVVLLVDAEAPVSAPPRDHLATRDRWDMSGVSDDAVHLMIQTMEAWIVADPEALARYYRQGFMPNALPRAENLETVSRSDVAAALQEATRRTQKGAYHKIRHASDLLRLIDPATVRRRCPGAERLFRDVGAQIAAP